ncbi:MAG: hypothetical protein SNJ52_02745 [Verrucomicrobiia bacterium]
MLQIRRYASKGPVEVDDMQPVAAFLRPSLGKGSRIIGLDRLLKRIAAGQPHNLTVHQINRRIE